MKNMGIQFFVIVCAMIASNNQAQQSPKSALKKVMGPILAAPEKSIITLEGKDWIVEKREIFHNEQKTHVTLKEKESESELCVQYMQYVLVNNTYTRILSSKITVKGNIVFLSTAFLVGASYGIAKYFNI